MANGGLPGSWTHPQAWVGGFPLLISHLLVFEHLRKKKKKMQIPMSGSPNQVFWSMSTLVTTVCGCFQARHGCVLITETARPPRPKIPPAGPCRKVPWPALVHCLRAGLPGPQKPEALRAPRAPFSNSCCASVSPKCKELISSGFPMFSWGSKWATPRDLCLQREE